MKNVVIIGAGGHGKVVADIVLRSGDAVLGFLDDAENLPIAVCGIPVLGKVSDYSKFSDASFIVAVGNNTLRRKIVSEMVGVQWYTAIHPSAVISSMDTTIGVGSVIMANAVINPSAVVGSHCIINTAAVVEHDNLLGDFVHLSVGAKLGGTVAIGENTFVGMGSMIINNLSIPPDCIIGAGAIVIRNIDVSGTYVGNPARRIQ